MARPAYRCTLETDVRASRISALQRAHVTSRRTVSIEPSPARTRGVGDQDEGAAPPRQRVWPLARRSR